MLDGIKRDLVAGQNSFDKLKSKYRKIEQVPAENVLTEAYSKYFFENPEYENKFFNQTFDKAKANKEKDTKWEPNQSKFEFMIRKYVTAGKTEKDQIAQKDMNIEYKVANGKSGDKFLDAYKDGTKVIKVSEKDNSANGGNAADPAKTTYIIFGSKEEEYINKSERYVKNENGKKTNIIEVEKFEQKDAKGEAIVDLNAFDIAGHEVFKLYLMKKNPKYIKDNMENILTQMEAYQNQEATGEQGVIKNGFYNKFVEAITEKSKEDGNILVKYLDLIRADINQSITTPGKENIL